jgi:hypothetical protein
MCAEDLTLLGEVKEARALLEIRGRTVRRESAGPPRPWTGPGLPPVWNLTKKGSKLMRDALQAALASGDPTLPAWSGCAWASSVSTLSEAEAYDRAALADAEHERDPFLLTWAKMDLGFNRARFARFDEAIPFLDAAL